ncbi:MAG: hypothetical protein SFV15_15390 [Polyangiaceae bacterium]|nr:hypothetical protein [Polyangiaceae bacterium]
MARTFRGRATTTRAPKVLIGAGLAAAASLFAAHACSAAEPVQLTAADTHRRSPGFEIPQFGRPEQAKEYFRAMTEGDRRAIEVLDGVIRQARLSSETKPADLTGLLRDREFREARLRAYIEAMRGLPR